MFYLISNAYILLLCITFIFSWPDTAVDAAEDEVEEAGHDDEPSAQERHDDSSACPAAGAALP